MAPRASRLRRTLRPLLWAGGGACVAIAANGQGEPKRTTETYALSFVRGAGAEGCPSRQDLEREVSLRLGHSPFDATAPRSIEILTERTPEGYRSVVSALERDGKLLGRRVLVGEEPSCEPIFSATALAVALLIDPEAALRHDSRANEAVGRFEEPPAPPPVAPPPAPAAAPVQPAPPPRVLVAPPTIPAAGETPVAYAGAEVGVAFGLVPDVSPQVGIFVDGRPGSLVGFSLSALYVPKVAVADAQGTTLDVSLTSFGAALTLTAVDRPRFRFAPDVGLMAGALHVAVRGGQAVDSSDHSFFALGFGVRAEVIVINGFFLAARVGGVVPLIRRELSVEGALEPIWTQPPFAGLASLGAGWAFF